MLPVVDLWAVAESRLQRLETLTDIDPSDTGGMSIAKPGVVFQRGLFALLLVVLILFAPSCAELELLAGGSRGGPGPPPSGSLSVSFIDVGQGDGVLVQAGGESYLIDAGRPEE